ncbi:MAG: Na+/H+ antiporter subunit E [Marinilabiliaceae bacterium]|nr:Na+/H+ antiporter subunit E [Marinilabiliaceae bacterium]
MLKLYYFFYLIIFYLKEIIVTGIFTSKIILNKKGQTQDGEITYELKLLNQHRIIFLFNLISMTPGTLSIDLYDDNKKIDVHLLNIADKDKVMVSIERLEKLIKRGL